MTTNDYIYILLIILVLIVLVHHLEKNNTNENFKVNNDYLKGENKSNLGNPNLSHNYKNITIKNHLGHFSNFRNINNNKNKNIFLDNNETLLLHPNGYILINLEKVKYINAFHISGLDKFRLDISMNGKKFNKLFNGKSSKHSIFTKQNINKINNLQNTNTEIKTQYIKITNTNNKHSKPIKLEIYTKDNLNLNSSSVIKDYTLKNENEKCVSSTYYITSENNTVSHLVMKSKQNISSFTLVTNVPKLVVLNNDKKQYLEGGIEGIRKIKYFITPTNEFKLLPILENHNLDNHMYFIKIIELYKNNIIEGFKNHNEDSSNDKELIDEINNTIDIQKACQALENEEAINSSRKTLEDNKKNYLILENQMKEIQNLEKQIQEIQSARQTQINKRDKFNIAKYGNLLEKELEIKDVVDKRLEEQLNFNINLLQDENPPKPKPIFSMNTPPNTASNNTASNASMNTPRNAASNASMNTPRNAASNNAASNASMNTPRNAASNNAASNSSMNTTSNTQPQQKSNNNNNCNGKNYFTMGKELDPREVVKSLGNLF